MDLELKDKLIAFPEEILNILADYKKNTGVSASNYIRNATIRRMIRDKLIWFNMITLDVVTEDNKYKKFSLSDNEANEANKYCDGEQCNVPPQQITEKC